MLVGGIHFWFLHPGFSFLDRENMDIVGLHQARLIFALFRTPAP